MKIKMKDESVFPFDEILQKQRVLDATIFEKKAIYSYSEIFPLIERAIKDEISEFSNSLRLAKYWSNKQPDRTDVIEEYVDILHFIASITLGCGVLDNRINEYDERPQTLFNVENKELKASKKLPDFLEPKNRFEIHYIILNLEEKITELFSEHQRRGPSGHYIDLILDIIRYYLDIAEECGFSLFEIVTAYDKKYEKNIVRTKTNY